MWWLATIPTQTDSPIQLTFVEATRSLFEDNKDLELQKKIIETVCDRCAPNTIF